MIMVQSVHVLFMNGLSYLCRLESGEIALYGLQARVSMRIRRPMYLLLRVRSFANLADPTLRRLPQR